MSYNSQFKKINEIVQSNKFFAFIESLKNVNGQIVNNLKILFWLRMLPFKN